MFGVVLALVIVPTQSALADQTPDRAQIVQAFSQPPATPEQIAARTKLFTQAAATLPPPTNPGPKTNLNLADEKFASARAETERTVTANPTRPLADISAQVQHLKTPNDAKATSDVEGASTAGSTPPWPTCYQTNGTSYLCNVSAFSVPAGTAYRGQMIILASGGWDSNPTKVSQFANVNGQGWANAGYETYVVEHTQLGAVVGGYPSGVTATINAIQWYDLIRYLHPSDRICMKGISSGGHLSLLTGINRPGLNCVITEASPTDITTAGTSYSSPLLEPNVQTAFGTDPAIRTQFSPTAYSFSSRGLIPHAVDDPLVSYLNAGWVTQPSRPGLFHIVPDLVCDGVIPSPVFAFGHTCTNDGISATTVLTYFTKELNMAATGTP